MMAKRPNICGIGVISTLLVIIVSDDVPNALVYKEEEWSTLRKGNYIFLSPDTKFVYK